MRRAEALDRLDPLRLHVLDGRAEEPRHLAGVRSEASRAGRPIQDIQVPRQRGQRVGVDHEGLRELTDQPPHEGLRVGIDPEPGAERHGVPLPRQRRDALVREGRHRAGGGLGQRLRHGLHEERRDDGLLRAWRGDGDESGAGACGRTTRERRGSGLSERARDDQEVAVVPLVHVAAAAWQPRPHVGGLQHEHACVAAHFGRRDPDVDHTDVTGMRCAR